ncbi:MAG: domain containing protein [Ferruginibacter sp.]|nr:domain containing protein [Ferruginibacter sp.]
MKLIFTTFSFLILTCFATAQINCNTWVRLQNRFAAITTGDLDVTGNKITVEALVNMTGSSVDIVSKHKGANDVNYLLRPQAAEITTVNGYFATNLGSSPCANVLLLNKTYHAAFVYDGSTLKFYKNGVLIDQVAATGNLVTNNWNMAIGEHAPVVTPLINGAPNPGYNNQNTNEGYYDESFRGFINEVRIWNVARTQTQIKTYMNASLPNPTTQVGLLGYWVFNDLQNKQGNTSYNGTIEGLATINQTNTNCPFIADSCSIVLPVKLTGFNAYVFEKKEMKLNWHTEGETGIRSYTIQRAEASDFRYLTDLGTVNAANSGGANNYSFSDITLQSNKIYFYRLQITEITGSISWSDIKSGRISAEAFSIDFYPNPPEDGVVNVRFNDITGNTTLKVLNGTGQVLINKRVMVSPGSTVTLDLKRYPSGSYFINVFTPDNKITKRIVRL